MKEIELSWFNPITNFGKLVLWTKMPVPDCRLNRVPGICLEIKKLW